MCAAPTTLASSCLALFRTSLQLMHGKWLHSSHLHPLDRPCPPHPTNPFLQSQTSSPSPPYPPAPCTFTSPIIHPNPNPSLLLLRTTLCILQSCSGGRNPPCNNPRSGQEHPPTYYLIFTNTPPNPLPRMQPFCRCHGNTF